MTDQERFDYEVSRQQAECTTLIPLNKTRYSSQRYYLIRDGKGMGGYGKPDDHYLNQWVVARGVDRGYGYQSYLSVDYALREDSHTPEGVRQAIKTVLGL